MQGPRVFIEFLLIPCACVVKAAVWHLEHDLKRIFLSYPAPTLRPSLLHQHAIDSCVISESESASSSGSRTEKRQSL